MSLDLKIEKIIVDFLKTNNFRFKTNKSDAFKYTYMFKIGKSKYDVVIEFYPYDLDIRIYKQNNNYPFNCKTDEQTDRIYKHLILKINQI